MNDQPIPLSELQLDLDAPGDGWPAYLAARGVPIVEDDIGRPSISRSDARQLFIERRESEVRRREVAARNDAQADGKNMSDHK